MSRIDDYTRTVFEFLEKAQPGQIFTIARICKPENRDRFIAAVKLWIESFPYGGGVEFNSDYTKVKTFSIEEYIKPLKHEYKRTG